MDTVGRFFWMDGPAPLEGQRFQCLIKPWKMRECVTLMVCRHPYHWTAMRFTLQLASRSCLFLKNRGKLFLIWKEWCWEVLRPSCRGWHGGFASGNKDRSSFALPMGLRGLLVLQRLDHSLTRLAGHLGWLISDLQWVGAHRQALCVLQERMELHNEYLGKLGFHTGGKS